MTNKEALIAAVSFSVPDNMLEKALLDRTLTGASTYTSANAEKVDMCVIDLLQRVLSEPDVTEGGYSIRFDRKAVEARLLYLARKYDQTGILNQLTPTVTGKSVW